MKNKRIFDVRPGDIWHFQTNYGIVQREVIWVEDDACKDRCIGYRAYGDLDVRICLLPTFKRWWKGAEIHYAKDWSNRNSDGDALPVKESGQ